MYSNYSNSVTVSYHEHLANSAKKEAKLTSLRRDYYYAEQPSRLTKRQIEILNRERVNLNYCKKVVCEPAKRLNIVDWQAERAETQLLANQIYKQNRQWLTMSEVYINALRDGESYIYIEPSQPFEEEKPWSLWSLQEKVHWNKNNRLQYGVKVHRDSRNRQTHVSIRWHDDTPGDIKYREHRTDFYPDLIQDFVMTGSGETAEGTWELSESRIWTEDGTPEGIPMGIPVIEFKSPDGSMIDETIMCLQDSINDAMANMIGVGLFHAFPMLFATGTIATGPDELKIGVGEILEITNPDATLGRIPSGSADEIIKIFNTYINILSVFSATPLYKFLGWGATPPSGTALAAMELPLQAVLMDLKDEFGMSWERVMEMSMKIERIFGRNVNVDPGDTATPTWGETRYVLPGEQQNI
jgi:hypothetical protein